MSLSKSNGDNVFFRASKNIRIYNFIIILICLPLILNFKLFNKNFKSNKIYNNIPNTPSYNFTPTPTMTPIFYPQLFYLKTDINKNIKLPGLNTHYVLSGNNDNKFKYWYILITSSASDDITFISYMYEIGEKVIQFEYIGNNTKNAKYNFVKGLLK